ncbi:MAG: prolyl oligopeptidase family serine peptidase, partial [Aeoliella sp.]
MTTKCLAENLHPFKDGMLAGAKFHPCVVSIAVLLLLSSWPCRASASDAGSDSANAPYSVARHSLTTPSQEQSLSYLLLRPQGESAQRPAPLLIFLYGAGGSIDDYNFERPPYDRLRKLLAAKGFYILVPELGPNHFMNGHARHALDRIVRQVRADHSIDQSRVHIMGTSMGGGSALAYAIHRPDLICSACSLMGMTDLAGWYTETTGAKETLERVLGGSPDKSPEAYRQVSAMANLDVLKNIPVFLVHGDHDNTVKLQHSRQLSDALKKRGGRVVYRKAIGIAHEDQVVEGLTRDILAFLDDSGETRSAATSQSSRATAKQPSTAAKRTVLLVDDHAVLYRPGTKRVLHPLTRHANNPMLPRDKPWEGTVAYCSVHRDPDTGHYRLWYQAWPGCHLCYATSEDGVHWTKPNMGLVEYEGSKDNNILLRIDYGAGVLVDPRDSDPSRRYKIAFWEHNGTSVAFSPDGIHWTKYEKNPVIKGSHGDYVQPPLSGDPGIDADKLGGPPLSTSDVIDPIWDSKKKCYVIYAKTWLDGPDGSMHWKRAVVRTESKDFIHWTKPVLVIAPDEHDDPAGESSLARNAGGGGTGRKQLHSGPAFVYNDMYFATLQVLDAAVTGNMPIELALSHDGYRWQRPFREAMFVPPLDDKTIFDASLIWSNATPIFLQDEFRFYYGAYGHPWNSADPQQISGIGLATMPRDRFAGVRPTERIGQITLKAMDLSKAVSIVINADASKGSVRLEIL